MPQPVTAPQQVEPWMAALEALLGDRAAYEAESRVSREAALRFVSGLRAGRLEELLAGLEPAPALAAPPPRAAMEALSPEKRALLLKRLRRG